MFVAFSNLFMRKSIDTGGTTKAFLVFQMGFALLLSLLMGPIRTGQYAINLPIVLLGMTAGVILALMLYCLGRAIEQGPAGFTFSILNGATVMPGLIMAMVFGVTYGFIYNGWHALGSVLVIGGLYWAGRGAQNMQDKKKWILLSASMFALHVLILCLFQWRALLFKVDHPMFTANEAQSEWFMPFLYLAALSIQLALYLKSERRMPQVKEAVYGMFGGGAQMLCTFFLLWATQVASPVENAVIYPVFSVAGIVLSNLWSQRLYQEQVNWRACQLCAFGLIVGTVDWKAIAAAISW
jgi:multidrug transporter EmrE-like cation transporter